MAVRKLSMSFSWPEVKATLLTTPSLGRWGQSIHQATFTNITSVPCLLQGVQIHKEIPRCKPPTNLSNTVTAISQQSCIPLPSLSPNWNPRGGSIQTATVNSCLTQQVSLPVAASLHRDRQVNKKKKGNSIRCSGLIKGALHRNGSGSSYGFGSDSTQLHCEAWSH